MAIEDFINFTKLIQEDIKHWMMDIIGDPKQFESIENRSQRFLEEALELVQVTGLSKDQCHDLVNYVYNRPTGELPQELGGVMVTLAALSERMDQNLAECLLREVDRIHKPSIIEKVRKAIERKRNDGVGV